jgi:Phage integrase family
VRFRKAGFTTYITGIPWSEDFMRQYAAALEGVQQRTADIGSSRTAIGSIDALVVSYYKLAFPRLKASTQSERRYIIERFRKEHGGKPVRLLKREHIAAIIASRADAARGKQSAQDPAHAVRARYRDQHDHGESGERREEIQDAGRRLPHMDGGRGRAVRGASSDREQGAARPGAPVDRPATKRRRPHGMAAHRRRCHCGQAGEDRDAAANTLDIDPSLPESLASVPKTNMTFLVTKFGAPFTPGGFSNWFGAKCDEAGLQRQCTAHGLRKLVATRLADMACSEEEIKAITGHKSASEVARYTKARDQKRLAESAVGRLRKARATSTQGERKLSNLSTRLDKTASK